MSATHEAAHSVLDIQTKRLPIECEFCHRQGASILTKYGWSHVRCQSKLHRQRRGRAVTPKGEK